MKNYLNEFLKAKIRFEKVFLLVSCVVIWLFFIYIVYDYMAKVGAAINFDDSNVPVVIIKADTCSSPYVENEIISAFKTNDPYFKYIDLRSVDSIDLNEKETITSDNQQIKNICSGTITVSSSTAGFKPKTFDNNNLFYNQFYLSDEIITKYTFYKLPIIYTSQIIEGRNYVEINNFYLGEFSCNGRCKTFRNIEIKKEKPVIQTPKSEEQTEIRNDNSKEEKTEKIEQIETTKKIKFFRRKKERNMKKKLFKIFNI